MEGVHYKYANGTLLGDGKDVYDLPICNFAYSDTGNHAVESCWKMTFKERIKAFIKGKIYFQCMGNIHPPIRLTVESVME